MKTLQLALLLVTFLLGGCKSTAPTNTQYNLAETYQKRLNANYKLGLDNYAKKPQSISYKSLWLRYVKSDFLIRAGMHRNEFDDLMGQVQSGQRSCDAVSWNTQQRRLFFSISVHMAAQECYDSLGMTAKADYHANTVNFIIQGLFANSDGKHHYSAHEVPTATDAVDIVSLTGFDVLDNFIELGKNNRGLYYVFVVNDPDSGEQQQLYFDFTRYLHEVMEVEYPFAWISDQITNEFVKPFAQSNSLYKYANAQLLVGEQKYDEAAREYLGAIEEGAVVANYRLGKLCQKYELSVINKSECFDYLLASAEGGYAKGVIAVAGLLRKGEGIEADEAGFEQLMEEAERRLPDGSAWRWLAYMADIDNKPEKVKLFERAAALGSNRAKVALLYLKGQAMVEDEEQALDVEQYYAEYAVLAEHGRPNEKTDYAKYLLRGKNAQENADLAKLMLLEAADKGYPEANYQLGMIYRYGKNEAVNYRQAGEYFLNAAQKFHLNAQLELGAMYEYGYLSKNVMQAFKWYTLCVDNPNFYCLHNMGILMMKGHIPGLGDDEAVGIFKALAEQEHESGMTSYGLMLEQGRGTEKDMPKAVEYYQKAAELGNKWAQHNLCLAHFYGKSIKKDHKKAKYWCEKSAAQGHQPAINKLQQLNGVMVVDIKDWEPKEDKLKRMQVQDTLRVIEGR